MPNLSDFIDDSTSMAFHLRVAFLPIAPYIQSFELTNNGYKIEGILNNILNCLANIFKFSYTLSMPPDKKFGLRLPNGTWSGLVGTLVRNETDMILGVIGINELRSKYVQFANGYHMSTVCILASTGRGEPTSFFSFLLSFDAQIWLWMVVILLLLIGSTSIFDLEEEISLKRFCSRLYKNSWLFVSAMFCEGSPRFPPTRRSQFMLALWLAGVLVLSNCFFSQFKALLMTEGESDYMNTVQDLADRSHILPLIPSGSLFELVFQGSELEAYRTVYRRAISRREECLIHPYLMSKPQPYQQVKSGKHVFVCDLGTMKSYLSHFFFKLKGGRRLYIVPETFFPFQHAMAFRKDFSKPLLGQINKRIQWMRECGLIERWMEEVTRDFWMVEQSEDANTDNPLGLKHLLPLFYMLGVMQLCCLFVLLLEYYLRKSQLPVRYVFK